jgi:hypothetical protein
VLVFYLFTFNCDCLQYKTSSFDNLQQETIQPRHRSRWQTHFFLALGAIWRRSDGAMIKSFFIRVGRKWMGWSLYVKHKKNNNALSITVWWIGNIFVTLYNNPCTNVTVVCGIKCPKGGAKWALYSRIVLHILFIIKLMYCW